jgi:hypothetical protein
MILQTHGGTWLGALLSVASPVDPRSAPLNLNLPTFPIPSRSAFQECHRHSGHALPTIFTLPCFAFICSPSSLCAAALQPPLTRKLNFSLMYFILAKPHQTLSASSAIWKVETSLQGIRGLVRSIAKEYPSPKRALNSHNYTRCLHDIYTFCPPNSTLPLGIFSTEL